jgi:hypothetical protein
MFAGLHFTGSTAVFNEILYKTATNLQKGLYLSYPRIGTNSHHTRERERKRKRARAREMYD